MSLRCPSCNQAYPLDVRQLSAAGIRLQCDNCSSFFIATPDGKTQLQATTGVNQAIELSGPFTIKVPSDNSTWTCPDVATLLEWHDEGRLLEDDLVSSDGSNWTSTGELIKLLRKSGVRKPPVRLSQQTESLWVVPDTPSSATEAQTAAQATARATRGETGQWHQAAAHAPAAAPQQAARQPPPTPRAAAALARAPESPQPQTQTPPVERSSQQLRPPFRQAPEVEPQSSDLYDEYDDLDILDADEGQWSPRSYNLLRNLAILAAILVVVLPIAFFVTEYDDPFGPVPMTPLPPRDPTKPPLVDDLLPRETIPQSEEAAPEAEAPAETAPQEAQPSDESPQDDGAAAPADGPPAEEAPAHTDEADGATDDSQPAEQRAAAPQPTAPPQDRAQSEPQARQAAAATRTEPRPSRASVDSLAETGSLEEQLRAGQEALSAGDYANALRLFNAAHANSPRNPDAAIGEARALLGLNRVDAAGVTLTRFLDSGSRYAPAWLLLGEVRERQGRHSEARQHYQHILEIAPIGSSAAQAQRALDRLP